MNKEIFTHQQAASRKRWAPFLERLRSKVIWNGCKIDCWADHQGLVTVQMSVRNGSMWHAIKPVVFAPNENDYNRIVMSLMREYLALHEATFLKTFAPDLYHDDGSPVEADEEVDGGDDVYF